MFGVDTNEEAISYLNETLAAFLDNGVATTSDEFSNNFFVADGLFDVRETDYDIAIGNPPYVRCKISKRILIQIKRGIQHMQKGNVDIYYAFVEKYLRCKKSSLIVPNSF